MNKYTRVGGRFALLAAKMLVELLERRERRRLAAIIVIAINVENFFARNREHAGQNAFLKSAYEQQLKIQRLQKAIRTFKPVPRTIASYSSSIMRYERRYSTDFRRLKSL